MSRDEQERWDARYREGTYVPRPHASPFLVEWAARIPTGRALDLAAGAGRNAFALSDAGFDVTAIDGSAVAIEQARAEAARRGVGIDWQVADLDDIEFEPDAWNLITVVRYRNEQLWPKLVDALAPDGWLLIDHHIATDFDVGGPRSVGHRLQPQELLTAFSGLRVVHYSEQLEPADDRGGLFAIARFVACKGDPGF